MREKNGMLEPPYCFFYSVQALTLHFGSFLLCFAMPGILCLGEIIVTCQCSIKRGKKFLLWHLAAALCFRLRRAIWEMEKTHKNPPKKQRAWEREWAKKRVPRVSVQCPVFQAHPKVILHLVRFPSSSTSFSPQPSVLPHTASLRVTQEAKHGYTHTVWRGSYKQFFHQGALQFVYHVGALWKLRRLIINNLFWPGEPLFGAELHFVYTGIAAPSFHVWTLCESLRSLSGL